MEEEEEDGAENDFVFLIFPSFFLPKKPEIREIGRENVIELPHF